MPLCKECEQLGERSGTNTYEEKPLDKGEKCDRCKTSYEETNEPENHEHDWQPDGESWTTKNHDPSCEVKNSTGIGRAHAIIKCDCETKRKRRYTCHCGESKIVEV